MGFIHEHGGWFIYPLILLGIVWFWRGGTEYQSAHEPFIQPLAPLGGGQTYGNIYLSHDGRASQLDLPENPIKTVWNFFNKSQPAELDSTSYSRIFVIDGHAGTGTTDPQEEYIRILASQDNTESKTLSGLVLTSSAYGIKGTIPPAVNMFVLSTTTKATPVSMPANGRATISSGKSPVGASFRVNMCSGYLGQFQTFTPALRTDCPSPALELEKYGLTNELSCKTFVEKLPACRSFNGNFPSDISTACKKFVTEKLSYNACVADHSLDGNFYTTEWRIFFGSTSELWKNRQEIIHLYNPNGAVIDAIAY